MSQSEVARILWQIQQEYQASKLGLEGPASGAARHDFIATKTEIIGKCHQQLTELVGPEQAISIIANTIWSPADQGSHQDEGSSGKCSLKSVSDGLFFTNDERKEMIIQEPELTDTLDTAQVLEKPEAVAWEQVNSPDTQP